MHYCTDKTNIKKFTYSEVKAFIKSFPNDINYIDYYKHILLNNGQRHQFVNPNLCKPSFKNYIGNHVRHAVFKRLLKEGYRFKTYYKNSFDCMFLEK